MPLCSRGPRCLAPAMVLSDEAKRRMVQAGLAVPGWEAEGRAVARNISGALDSAGVGYVEIGRDFATVTRRDALSEAPPAPRNCTQEEPCSLDGDLLRRLALAPAPLLLVAFAYAAGTRAAASDDDWVAQLEQRAERSRARRVVALRDLGSRLEPVQAAFGWELVDAKGLPTANAYAFLVLAVVTQLALAAALVNPLQEALRS